MQGLKQRVYSIIRDDDDNNTAADIFDWIIIALILLSVIFIIIDTFDMPLWFVRISNTYESFTAIVFTIEYAARIWTAPLAYSSLRPAKARLRYAVRFMAVVDLLSILPFYAPLIFPNSLRTLRLLRLIRLFRLFKVNRYTHALDTIRNVFRKRASQLLSSFFAIVLLTVIASVLMYSLEYRAQPEVFENVLDGFWWSLATVTNADYGDIYPITNLGRVLNGLTAFLGILLIAVPTGIISAGFVAEMGGEPAPAKELYFFRKLLDNGTISKEEFEEQKEKLLHPDD